MLQPATPSVQGVVTCNPAVPLNPFLTRLTTPFTLLDENQFTYLPLFEPKKQYESQFCFFFTHPHNRLGYSLFK